MEVDGVVVGSVEHPTDEQQLAQTIAETHAAGLAAMPVGGGTQLYWGNLPRAADVAVCLDHLDQVVSHEAEDLLVTVQAGCPFHVLQRTLAQKNQWIPIDAFVSEAATIGGLVATNTYGPSRLRYGRLRDYLLGLRVVQSDGTQTKAGGRVVKNVSGYDLAKLYAGSLGWLGVFTEFHLKTIPKPELERSGWASSENLETLRGLGQKVLDEGLEPAAQVLTPASALKSNGSAGGVEQREFVLMIKFADHPEAVDWEWSRVSELAAGVGDLRLEFPDEEPAACLWRMASGVGFSNIGPETAVLKIIAPYRCTVSLVEEVTQRASSLGLSSQWLAYAGAHLLWVVLSPGEGATLPVSEMASWLESLRRKLRVDRGELILARAPRALKERFEVWGVEGKPLELMQAIKRNLDPKGTLNPGRFVGRL